MQDEVDRQDDLRSGSKYTPRKPGLEMSDGCVERNLRQSREETDKSVEVAPKNAGK